MYSVYGRCANLCFQKFGKKIENQIYWVFRTDWKGLFSHSFNERVVISQQLQHIFVVNCNTIEVKFKFDIVIPV